MDSELKLIESTFETLLIHNERNSMVQITINLSEIDVQYDSENDVIYVSFGKPQETDDSVMLPNGIVICIKNI